MKKPKTLRARMAGAIFLSLLLLWAVLMSLIYASTKSRIEMQTNNQLTENARYLRQNIEAVVEGTAPPQDKRAIHEYRLSNNASALNDRGGGLTYRMYDVDGTELARTQLAYGEADTSTDVWTSSGGNRYHLSMDEALDDDGLLDYLNWIVAYRYRDSAYVLHTPEEEYYPGDGTVALVTGVVEYNHIRVQRIVLRHPDGSETLVLEGKMETFAGETLTTLEFPSITLDSPLIPGLSWSDGEQRSEKVDLQARLTRYRATEARLDAFFKEKGASTNGMTSSGYMRYEGRDDGTSLAYAWSYSSGLCAHDELMTIYIFTLLVALALGLFLSKHLSRNLSQPLEQLTHDAARGRPCGDQGPIREVNTLATAVNAAQKKMADDLRREQSLTRAVAHELKTPLAILRSHAEALSEDIDPAKRSAYLNIIMDESDRMAALVGELLDLSRMEHGAETLNRQEVDLKALTQRVFAPLQNLARISLTLESVFVSGDPKLLERAISNYASNALRHCAPGGEIRATLLAEGGTALLTVENDGEPIPPEALPRLFDTFYKADSARTRGQGTGLGLAIVRGVAALHGGSCGAENGKDGPAFRLSLPCNSPPAVVL